MNNDEIEVTACVIYLIISTMYGTTSLNRYMISYGEPDITP